MSGNFFGGQFFGGGFFGAIVSPVVGGHGSEGDDGDYSEPRRVIVAGKPYTVTRKAQYLGLLARASRDRAREQADASIGRAQEKAREALQARATPTPEVSTAEIAALMQLAIAKQRREKPQLKVVPVIEDGIPVELLMLLAADL